MSATPATTPAPPPPAPPADAPPAQVEAPGYAPSWSVGDKIGVGLAWFAGLLLCVIAGSIVIYMLVRGIQYVSFDLLTKHPQPSLDQSKSGGFLDPIIGTFVLTILGTLIAAPLGVAIAVWLSEYGKPAWLARAVESGIEIVADRRTRAPGLHRFALGPDAVHGRPADRRRHRAQGRGPDGAAMAASAHASA